MESPRQAFTPRHALTRKIFGAMGLFGSVEMLTMLCSVIRTKLMAVWGGAVGVGLLGLYGVALEMLSTLAEMGLRVSSVRDIARTSGAEADALSRMVRRIGLLLGCVGALATAVFSPLLSLVAFGDASHCWAFIAIGAGVFFSVVRASELAILQGRGLLRRIAVASLVGMPVSLVLAVPMIYFWRADAALPVLMTYIVVLAVMVWLLRVREASPADSQPLSRTLYDARGLLRMGFMLTISAFAVWASGYIIMSFVNQSAGEDAMGYYQAGYTMAVKYVGVVFTALTMEYYPRLSAASAGGVMRTSVMLHHQIRIVLSIVVPAAILMIVLAPIFVKLLYSSEFICVVPLVVMAAPGVVLRGASWCMGFVFLAHGDSRWYVGVELTSCMLCVVLSILGFSMWGLTGIGIAFSVWYLFYTLMVTAAIRYKKHISIRKQTVWGIALSFVGVSALAVAVTFIGS